jgi:hypothetical protein
MLVDMTQPIRDLHNKPALRDGKPFLLRDACQEALLIPKEQDIAAVEKFNRFQLALKLNEDMPDLSFEQIVKLKEAVGSVQGPLVYGRVCELLEEKKLAVVKETLTHG